MPNSDPSSQAAAPRMWTCTKCSYTYNPIWVDICDICTMRRTPPSLTQPSLITVTKDKPSANIVDPRNDEQNHVSISNKTEAVKFTRTNHQSHSIDDVVEVPMATFEQDFDDNIQDVEDTVDYPQEWTCKKCTLVNSIKATTCVVCGGSKLKSVSAFEELTLRKGEFWVCTHCTLKNSLSTTICAVCKSVKQTPVISGQQTNFRPYTSTPASNLNNKNAHNRSNAITAASSSVQAAGGLTPPVHRVLRSPSPKYDRTTSGAIPKVIQIYLQIFFQFNISFFSLFKI